MKTGNSVMRSLAVLGVAFAFSLGSVASAAPCRDGKGKFVTCTPVAAAAKCRDAKGKFIKCSAVTAVPK